MFLINTAILVAGVLLLLGIASSKFSARLGMPVLVMFLGLGMLAGSEGIGGIAFEDYSLAYAIGTLALALILFDGGLRTPYRSIRAAWKPAGILATAGVFITAVVTGVAASWILQLSLTQGLLLGSIVGSTDAAAVFSVLRSGGVHIRRRLADTLEVESGSNDPMAIFMTVGLIEVLSGQIEPGAGLLLMFLRQMVVGLIVGLLVGRVAVWAINHIQLGAAGLYPVLATAFGLFTFGLAADLGGSGFLAVYLAGMVIGNSRIVFHRGILLFHDAAAWLGQILMFIVLGLLSFPSRLLDVFVPGMAIAVVLVLVARPLAVALTLFPFRYSIRERLFLSWVGLKGAVPITLATFPLLAGLPAASLTFDIVFFVVLVSAVVQGWSLPWVARWLQLEVPPKREPPVTLEISSLFNVEGDIVDYYVDADTPAAGQMVKDLALPEEVVVALIVRNQQTLLPKGGSKIEAGDHVIVVLRPAVRPMVDRVFARREHEVRLTALPTALEFPLKGRIKVGELEQFYDITLSGNDEQTLDEWIRERAGKKQVTLGFTIPCDQLLLCVRGLTNEGHIEFVGMTILPETVKQPRPSAKAIAGAAASPETPPAMPPEAADETDRLS
ncbi:MAG TPA: potassium/proton antiporter [Pirellulaceae bacterium]|nr:potassium/proton antiporter [Pirellulaceae bacterium]